MDDAYTPPTEPAGSMIPPTKVPGTAIATATPPPPPNREPRHRQLDRFGALGRAIERTLDAVDAIADNVAVGLGLRRG